MDEPPVDTLPYLDAARDCILAVGFRRTTLTEVARRAGVSRMTIYRRWPDTASLLADLLVHEWSGLVDQALTATDGGSTLDRLASGAVSGVRALRDNELFRRIVEVDPELLLPYLLRRRGRNQDRLLALVRRAVKEGQADGSIRPGDATTMARALVLAVHGFVLSSRTMTSPRRPTLRHLDAELAELVRRYLA